MLIGRQEPLQQALLSQRMHVELPWWKTEIEIHFHPLDVQALYDFLANVNDLQERGTAGAKAILYEVCVCV